MPRDQEAVRRRGTSALPADVLLTIFECLVAGLEPGGVWGPSLVVRDLANAALVRGQATGARAGRDQFTRVTMDSAEPAAAQP
jgi:hypothetical protein